MRHTKRKAVLILSLLAGIFLLFSFGAVGDPDPAIYYVDFTTGDDGDSGLTEELAWKTINKVNTSSFNAGDSILFKRGEVWREQLTVPSSGSSGNPITFGAYGSGAKPIINGADIITGWSQSGGYVTSWSQTIGGSAEHGTNDYNMRSVITGATQSGTKVKVTFKAGPSGGTLDGASIGEQDGSSDDFTASPTRITFDGGNNYKTIGAGAEATSDEITYTFTHTNDHLVHCWMDDGYSMASQSTGGAGIHTQWGVLSDDTLTQTVTYTPLANYKRYVTKIEVYQASSAYQATCTTEPNQVWYNGTRLTENDGATTGVGSNEWDWASNILYVNVGEDPDMGILESASRTNCIVVNAKQYLTFENLELKYSNGTLANGGSGIEINTWTGTAVGITIQNCTIHDTNWCGIYCYSTAGNENTSFTIQNNTLYNCAFSSATTAGIMCDFIDSSTISNNTIYSCQEHGIRLRNSDSNTIESNVCYSNGSSGITITDSADPGNNKPTNNIIRYNRSYGNDTIDGAKANIELVHSGGRNKYYYNLAYNSKTYGMRADGATNEDSWYNNVIYNSDAEGIYVWNSSNFTIKNNIVAESGNEHVEIRNGTTGHNINNNLYGDDGSQKFNWGGTQYNFADWKTSSSQDANSPIPQDPLFTDPANGDFTLQSSSPCIDAGTNVGLTQDYAGTTVPQGSAPDIGAYEYESELGIIAIDTSGRIIFVKEGQILRAIGRMLIMKDGRILIRIK